MEIRNVKMREIQKQVPDISGDYLAMGKLNY